MPDPYCIPRTLPAPPSRRCQFELGNTAMMVHYLTDPAVASHRLLGNDWSVQKLLGEVATSTDPPFHALIDGGALVTGMTNLEVARWAAVVFGPCNQ